IREGRLKAIPLGGGWRVSETALRDFVAGLSETQVTGSAALTGGSLFTRFSSSARRVVVLGQEAARELGHGYIGTEHLLLGVLGLVDVCGAEALRSFGMTYESAVESIIEKVGRGSDSPKGHIPFTPRAKKVMELTLREALATGENRLFVDHVVLALAREGQGVAAQVMSEYEADLDSIRAAIDALLDERPTLER
ncbi:MAG: hypothetical protein LC723_00260, partial [Actinobacteria bacterium]|nr:hypothetical protein [Actinomycetota bacterium]